jgi:hypothetical protein
VGNVSGSTGDRLDGMFTDLCGKIVVKLPKRLIFGQASSQCCEVAQKSTALRVTGSQKYVLCGIAIKYWTISMESGS